MSEKLSQIVSGGALAPTTDQLVTVRSGATDVLTTPGQAAAKAVSNNSFTTVPTVSGVIVSGHFAKFADTAGTVQDGGVAGTAAAQGVSSITGIVAAVNGGTTTGHLATFSDTAGTIQDGGAIPTLSSLGGVPTSRTVNGHALTGNVVVSASDLTTGTVPVAQLPVATSGTEGIVQPDNTTITISGGVISAVGGGANVGVGNLNPFLDVTGTTTVSSLSFTPKSVIVFFGGHDGSISHGASDGTVAQSYTGLNSLAGAIGATGVTLAWNDGAGNALNGVVGGFASTGFTITWSHAGSPPHAGAILTWVAIG